jgi:hypothetical protein
LQQQQLFPTLGMLSLIVSCSLFTVLIHYT